MVTSQSWRCRAVDWFRKPRTTTVWWMGWLGIGLKAGVIVAGLVVLSRIPVEETVAMNAQLSARGNRHMTIHRSDGGELPKSLSRGRAIRVGMGDGLPRDARIEEVADGTLTVYLEQAMAPPPTGLQWITLHYDGSRNVLQDIFKDVFSPVPR